MGLETATYLNELNSSNPDGADLKSQGDDHLRLIKAVLKATFPNASRAFRLPNSLAAQAADYTLVANIADNIVIPCNAGSVAFTVTLPATPAVDGTKVLVMKTDVTANTVTVSGNGNSINDSTSFILNCQYESVLLVWLSAVNKWIGIGSTNASLATGMMMAYGKQTAPSGWVRCNGQTIGNAVSSASERANADTANLYTFLWNNYSDSICPVSSGRGGSAAADFSSAKTIVLPDLRGRALFGLDDMGGSAIGRLAGASIDQTTNGASGGADTVTLARANLPNVDLTPSITIIDPTHAHSFNTYSQGEQGSSRRDLSGNGGQSTFVTSYNTTGITASSSAIKLNGDVTQTVVDKLPPAFLVTWVIKM